MLYILMVYVKESISERYCLLKVKLLLQLIINARDLFTEKRFIDPTSKKEDRRLMQKAKRQ